MSHRSIRPVAPLLALVSLLVPLLASAAVQNQDDWCDESRRTGDSRVSFCEVREYTLAAPRGALAVDGGLNGGIKVEAWDRKDVLVQAKVEVWAEDRDHAEEIAGTIRVTTDGARVVASGPDGETWRWVERGRDRRVGWGVSYRVYVPRHIDLDLETHNGGIGVAGVTGRIRLEAMNGALALDDVGGDVAGRTTNGSLIVDLDGSRWDGAGLDLVTTNGSVALQIPDDYDATLETGTTNGRMNVDFPVVVRGDLGRRLRVDLGKSGAPIRLITTNGSVRVARGG